VSRRSTAWGLGVVLFGMGVGVGLSIYLLLQHVALEFDTHSERSLCAVNAAFDCDAVAVSSYAEIFGVPWAALGLSFYLAIIILIGLAFFLRREVGEALEGLVLLALAFSAVLGLLLTAEMVFLIGSVCLVCLACHVLDLGLFLVYLWLRGRSLGALFAILRPLGEEQSSARRIVLASVGSATLAGLLGLCAAPILGYANLAAGQEGLLEQRLAEHYAQAAITLVPPPAPPVFGTPGAPVQVVEFSDFQCPHCRQVAHVLETVLPQFGKNIAFYFMHFPLSTRCQEGLPRDLHPFACQAARFALCAERFGVFYEFHRQVYERQAELFEGEEVEARLQALLISLGPEAQAVEQCYRDPSTSDRLNRDIEEGRRLGLSGTPSLFIDGRKVAGRKSVALLRALLQHGREQP